MVEFPEVIHLQISQESVDESTHRRLEGSYKPHIDCPIAIELKKLFPESNVHVGYQFISLNRLVDHQLIYGSYPTTSLLKGFIQSFDMNAPFQLITYELKKV